MSQLLIVMEMCDGVESRRARLKADPGGVARKANVSDMVLCTILVEQTNKMNGVR